MLHLSVNKIFGSIGNLLQIGIKKNHVQDMLPLNRGGDKCQILVCGPIPL